MSRKSKKSAENTPEDNALMFDQKRRKVRTWRVFTYGAMTAAIIIGVAVCIGWAMGYRFDLDNGLSQVALLQFNTFPTGATVNVNDTDLLARTPTRSNIKAGTVTVKMNRQGYRSWQKTVSAIPSTVRWLNYVRLVPNNIKTDTLRTFANVDDAVHTGDSKWAMVLTDEESGAMTLIKLSDPENVKFTNVKLDSSKITAGSDSKYKLLEWDPDNRYLLIEHHYTDDNKKKQVEHLEYDRTDSTIKNISRDFGVTLIDPHFSGNNGKVLFAITDGGLRKMDYGNKTISAPLASNVQSYVMLSTDKIAYVTKEEKEVITDNKKSNNDSDKDDKSDKKSDPKSTKKQTVQNVMIYNDGKNVKIKSYNDNKKTQITFSKVNDVEYLSIARAETVSVYPDPLKIATNGPDAVSKDVAYLSSPGGIDELESAGRGRFVVASYDHKVSIYDIETTEHYSFSLERSGKPVWLDDFHILDVRDGKITMIEFDGQNAETLVSGQLPAFLSNNAKYLFSFDAISGGVSLQRSAMTTEN